MIKEILVLSTALVAVFSQMPQIPTPPGNFNKIMKVFKLKLIKFIQRLSNPTEFSWFG
jgi:hypothetical protein